MKKNGLITVMVLALGFAPGHARADSDATLEQLNARVQALEAQAAQHDESVARQFQDMRAGNLRVHLGVYGSLNYSAGDLSGSPDKIHHEFVLGTTDYFITGNYGDSLSFLNEMVNDWGDGNLTPDLERIWVAYTVSDKLRIRAGRDHTALGYWNRTFHHGAYLALSVDRPFFLKFEDEGGILPVHNIGIFAEGSFDSSLGQLKYEANVGNGARVLVQTDGAGSIVSGIMNPNPDSDNNNDKLGVVRLVFKPGDGNFSLGVSEGWSQIDASSDDPQFAFTGMGQVISSADMEYISGGFQLIGEYFNLNDDVGGYRGKSDNNAFYVQGGYTLADVWTPYARAEYLAVNSDDPFFRDLQVTDRQRYLAGLRYDLVPGVSCIKLEYQHVHLHEGGESSIFFSQWAFGF